MLIYTSFSLLMFFSGLVAFSVKRKHLLLMLLSMEFIVLSLFMMMYVYLSFINNEYFFSMIFITFSVCEAVLGLSIMVSLIRSHGNDYFQSFSVLW